jgi:hypothetical protein
MSDGEDNPLEAPKGEPVPEVPEMFKPAVWAWHHSRANRELLMRGPVLALAVASLFLGYWFGSSRESELLKIKDERNTFLVDQIAAYKDRLQGATPDEAAKKFSDLERQLATQSARLQLIFPDKQRDLTDPLKSTILDNIVKIRKDVKMLYMFSYSLGDSPQYALEISDIFRKNAVPVAGPFLTQCSDNQRGIIVGLMDENNPSIEAKDFENTLRLSGLTISNTKWMPADGVPKIQDFDLFICPDWPTNPQAGALQVPKPQGIPEGK